MKLRIKGNSLRLRIGPSEMIRLAEEGRIEETICFGSEPGAKLTYALEHNLQTAPVVIRYKPTEIAVILSSRAAQLWASGEEVGLYHEIETPDGPLQVVIEKDFACLDKTDAENVDTFPNPRQGAVC